MYGHNPGSTDSAAHADLYAGRERLQHRFASRTTCRINYFEWCQDHNKPLQVAPFGDVPRGGPATLPDPNIFTNGAWYSGSPYLGPDATTRADRANQQLFQPVDTSRPTRPTSAAGRSCGTRTTSARSPPTTFSRRNADDDAGRFPGIRDRRIELR